ncbi:MAG: RecX family transcriptional regulator [Eubacteriales bacterium]
MVITQLVELSKSRSKVYIEEEFAFVLYKGELRRYGMKEGEELGEEDYQEIMEKILPKRAKLRCMNLLSKKTYTEAQLYQKLQNDYQENFIQEAIDYVKSYGYVNDEQYAIDYISYHQETKSRKQIEMDLRKRGIPEEIVKNTLEGFRENSEQQENLLIQKFLEKKRYSPIKATYEDKDKMIRFLLRKGFEYALIKNVMKEYIYHENDE